MMTSTSNCVGDNMCPICRQPVTDSVAQGLCLACLLEAGFDTATAAAPAAESEATASEQIRLRYFGDYELLREIGRGGMGIVYEARQFGTQRSVALKLLAAGAFATPEAVHRFHTEAQAAARLEHPGIVPIYEAGAHDGQYFLAMRFMAGGTLAQAVGAGQMGPQRAAEIVRSLARAVHHAHLHGVLHRDLKPGNVLLDAEGNPYVADFGLARLAELDSRVTLTASVFGTAAYMPPEQAAGGAAAVTMAADIYGLGAILYELLTGHPPFTGSSIAEILRKVQEEAPARPLASKSGIRQTCVSLVTRPSSLERDLPTICFKCLEKEPPKRYATAQDLADDLERFLNGEPICARPVTGLERAARWCLRKPALASALVLVLLLVLVLGIGSPIAAYRINRARQQAEEGRQQAEALAYTSDMNVVQQAWDEGNLRRAQALLQEYVPQPGERDLRGFEWRYLWKLCRNESRVSFTNFPAEVRMAMSPDGSFVAAGSGRIVMLLDYLNGRELDTLRLPDGARAITALAFSTADINVFATASGETLHFWNLAERRITSTLTLSTGSVALAFSPDGKLLAAAGGYRNTVELWRVEDRSLVWMSKTATPLQALAFTPDGKSLIYGGGEMCEPLQWGLANGISSPFPAERQATINAVEFSPDGQLMATSSNDGTAILWDLAERKLRARLIARGADAAGPAKFSPDGRWLATGHADSTVRLWDVATQQQRTIYRGHRSGVLSLAFSPDGGSIISSGWDRTVKVWDLEPRSHEEILTTSKGWVRTSLFSPDSKRLVTRTMGEDRIMVWDVATRSRLADLGSPAIATGPAAFSPDGETLFMVSGRRIALWDAATFAPRGSWTNDFNPFSLSFTPDSRTLAVSGLQGSPTSILDGITNRLAFWDVTTQRRINKLAAAAPFAIVVAFSHDGKKVAIGYFHGEVRLWDYETERLLAEFTDQHRRIWSVAFSPDDAWLVAGGFDGVVVFHDLRARRTFRSIQTSTWIHGLCFTPDGRTLASAEGDGTIKLWNFATREIALTLKGHVGPLGVDLSFSSDGKYLATSGADGTVRLWPAATPDEIPKSKGREHLGGSK